MKDTISKSVNQTAGFLVLCLVVLGMAGWGYLTFSGQKNDASLILDADWAGNHVCPAKQFPQLNNPLQARLDRPNEDALWKKRLEYETSWIGVPNKKTNREEWARAVESSTRTLRVNENHYRIEVRRTVVEMEARHPLCLGEKGRIRDDEHPLVDARLGIPLLTRPCYRVYPQQAHDSARADVLDWYADQGKYPANSTKGVTLPAGSITKR